ncbi:DUF1194 domain-containing protein [Pelagibius sp. CAU 1746]|uniref:DUF1194 domain-containing protein n=1 Tax=Pelagibius sp. CAU 1746 TaxID=3140370 RepID=UPI00325B9412
MVRIGGPLAALLALFLAAAPIPADAQAPASPGQEAQTDRRLAVDLELVLAVDVSLSVDSEEAQLQRQGYAQAFRDPLVVDAIGGGILGRIAVTYFEWANSAHTRLVVDWTLIDSPAAAERFAMALAARRPGPAHYTSISGAIDFGSRLFQDNGFEGTREVIDVSGDGPNNWGDLVTRARDRAVAQGITINGLPILDRSSGPFSRYNIPNLDLYYRDCVIGGPAAFIVVAQDFTAFASAIRRKLILEIAGPPAPPPRSAQLAKSPLVDAQFIDDGDARISPPCDIGEQLLRSREQDF